MNSPQISEQWRKELPDFETTLAALVRLPPEGKPDFVFTLVDQSYDITYRISSPRILEPRELRQATIRALQKLGQENKRSVTYYFESDSLDSE